MLTLDCQNLSLPSQWPYSQPLAGVSFTVAPGELVVVLSPGGQGDTPLPDLALGLLAPAAGQVRCLGEAWTALSATAARRRRHQVRRLFTRHGWLSNLDVWENLILAESYHGTRPEADLLAEAHDLALALGLPDLPAGRPELQPAATLRLCQWVRLLLGDSVLWLVENPLAELPPEALPPLLAQVTSRRRRGTGILWLTDNPRDLSLSALAPTRVWGLDHGHMAPWSPAPVTFTEASP